MSRMVGEATVGSVTDEDLVVGDEASRQAAREARRREQRLALAMRSSSWRELPRNELIFGRHWIKHEPTGAFYVPTRGEASEQAPVAAYFIATDGDVVFLERPTSGPRSLWELEQRRARPKPVPRRRRRRGA